MFPELLDLKFFIVVWTDLPTISVAYGRMKIAHDLGLAHSHAGSSTLERPRARLSDELVTFILPILRIKRAQPKSFRCS